MGVVGKSVRTNLGNAEIVAETACLSLIRCDLPVLPRVAVDRLDRDDLRPF